MTTLFGTDGIRGRVGEGIFTHSNLLNLGHALALWTQEISEQPHILIVNDTRISCSYIKSALKTSLLTHPLTLYDAGILPTSAALYLTQQLPDIDCALIISASHNPYYDNGIKLFTKKGKLKAEEEQAITDLFYQNHITTYRGFGQDHYFSTASSLYSSWINTLFLPSFLTHKKIVLDTAHGSTYLLAEQIFKNFGAHVIMLHNKPDGFNINQNCGTLHGDTLQRAVIEHKADIGFAFDGDGDRVIAVNRQGIIKDGDDILALLIQNPTYRYQKTVVGTVMSNFAFEDFLRIHHKTLQRTPVGDKYIVEYLIGHQLLLGGEPSGHVILQDILPTGDGILTALRLLETLFYTNNWEMETFAKYPQISINVPIKQKKDLNQPPYTLLIKQAEEQLSPGRLLIRYSGTESLLRVMAESPNAHSAEHVVKEVAYHLQTLLEQA